MIHDEICTYELCKLAKEKGFNVPTAEFYNDDGNIGCYPRAFNHNEFPDGDYAAPTQSLLQRWLREEKGVVFGISPMQEMDCEYLGWCVTIYKVDKNGYGLSWKEELYYDTYELVLENAMKYALENLV